MRSNNSRVRFEVWISKTPTVCFYFCCRSFLSIREEILDFTIRVSLLLPPLFSLPSSLSPLLSPLFPFFFLILFANTTKTAPVSPLNWCRGDFRFHDSSLSLPPLPLFLFNSFRQRYENSAGVAAKPMSRRFWISRFESLSFSLPSSLSPLLSPLLPFFFLILFANTTKTAPFFLDIPKSMVGLGISRTNADSQWNPVYNVFHRFLCFGNQMIRR